MSLREKLFFSRCAYGTSVRARTAANAIICIDYIFAIAFSDATGRACILASAAADALIGNFVCHVKKPPFVFCCHLYSNTFIKKIKMF